MAFEGLTGKLQSVFDRLRGKGKITEEDLDQALRDVRLALLEADVNFKVVKEFIASVREKAIGREVHKSFTPAMVIIDVVHKELTALMGGAQSRLSRASRPPTVVMAVGLQGAGKTTTCAKLARHLQKQHARPLLVAADVYRPAAAEQLKVLGGQIGVDVFLPGGRTDPVEIAVSAVDHARAHGYDYVVVDTAGRLHVDEMMMDELRRMRERIKPDETLLVVDAMTGQEAVRVAETFHRELSLTGVVLTKLDGDTRGGAALSVKAVTGCPIKFAATGEKIDALEPFHPDRMASRILGMGDMLTLIEKAQAEIDAEKAKGDGAQNPFRVVYLRRFSRTDGTAPQARPARPAARHVARRVADEGTEGVSARRKENGAPRGDRQVDDERRARQPGHPERESPATHRARQR